MEKTKITSIEALSILVKWRKFIIINFFLFSLTAAIISLILPKWYTSTCTLLPPQEQSMGGLDLMSLIGDMSFNLPNLPGMSGPSDVYVAILRSRNVQQAVVKENNLQEIYKKKTMQETLKTLSSHTQIDKSEENIIIIKTTARNRKLAAKMARSYVNNLDRVNNTTRITSARYTREFIEKRLQTANSDLEAAAKALRDFQKKNKVISIEEQTKAEISTAAQLEAEVALAEVSYNIAKKTMSSNHPDLEKLHLKLLELKKQVQKIETGTNLDSSRYVVPFEKLPDLGLQYAFLLRDVEVQKAIYKLLVQQLEQAKIQEARDTPTIQILDAPVEPELKSKPKRAIIVIVAAIFSVFVSFFIIFIFEYINRLQKIDPYSHQKLINSLHILKKDIPFRRKTKG